MPDTTTAPSADAATPAPATAAPPAPAAPAGDVSPLRTPVERWTLRVRGSWDAVPEHARAALADGLPVVLPLTTLGALVRAGLAPDVTVDGREEDVAWVATTAWEYRTWVPYPARPADRARLVLEGVDTIGRVVVDGAVRLEVRDMFRRHVVELGAADGATHGRPGGWDVRVEIDPVLAVAAAAEARNPLPRPELYPLPYNQVRKMACSFGWDWGPVTVSQGLWRPVVLETWSGARWGRLQVTGGWSAGGAELHVRGGIDGPAHEGWTARVTVLATAGPAQGPLLTVTLEPAGGAVEARLPVPGALPWQPVGLGDQPLHDVVLELVDDDGVVRDREVRRLGFRDVVVVQEPDAAGTSFELTVNGTRVWVRGLNWIPPHVLLEEMDPAHVRRLVGEAVAAGANLLRVWGGGVIESDVFYDVCDELGVLVWQDFPFACAAYPEDPATVAEVRAEVEDAVARVGHRTSLVLWCGCNENLWGYEEWGWREPLGDRPWGSAYYHQVLPEALAALDGSRPYIPGTPFSPGDARANDPSAGTTHHWDTWGELDYTAFDTATSRFAAEFGWQAAPGWPVLVRALGGEPTGSADPRLERLQKAHQGMRNLARGVADHLPHLPDDGRGWYLATQLVQARAVRAAVGRFRSLHDTCSGVIWWQLDDCWPSLSWSVLDVSGRRKLAWYALREVLSPRAALPTATVPRGLTLVNDTTEAWSARIVLTAAGPRGETLAVHRSTVEVPALGHAVLNADALAPHPTTALLVLDADGRRAVRWLLSDPEIARACAGALPARVHLAVVEASADATTAVLEVRTEDLIRDLVLLPETDPGLRDVVVEDHLWTLLPGETARLVVRGPGLGAVPAARWASLLRAAEPLDVTASA